MLPAAARLRRRADFVATVRGGRRRGHGGVVVHAKLTDSAETADAQVRVGFVVSRAVGGAVVRNQVRRRLRHIVRERLADLPAGATLVVRALPAAARRDHAALAADFDTALQGALRQRHRGRPRGSGGAAGDHPARVRRRADRESRSGGTDATPSRQETGSRWASITAIPASAMAAPIVAYRRWVSPALPPRCRYQPSCSEYALEAIQTHGALRGSVLAARRLLRCHPFHPGGYDPVPPVPGDRPRATVTGA